MTLWRSLFVAASLLTAPISFAHAQTPQTVKAKNVVLVHGAWADGSSWSEVIPILQAAGLHVTAVQNPLSSLADSVEATKRALAHAGMSIGDIDLVAINEAFAAQVVPSYQDLGIDLDRLNVNGGAIAVGHPFGMTGARLQNTMLNSLDWHDKTTGLITMCVGGGQGMALILERLA